MAVNRNGEHRLGTAAVAGDGGCERGPVGARSAIRSRWAPVRGRAVQCAIGAAAADQHITSTQHHVRDSARSCEER